MGRTKSPSRSRKRSRSRHRRKSRSRRRRARHSEKEPSLSKEQGQRSGYIRDSERPHFRWTRSMLLGPEGRYKVKSHLGDGTFGRVLAAKDRKTNTRVAVKVIKSAEHLRELAEEEAEVLWKIQKLDRPKLRQELQLANVDRTVPCLHLCWVD
eukprot:symbB.v1.2.012371.t3/scaffold839.1/size158637/10